ncbi:GNAT family N-acetyltransferase [Amycolatopsis rhabdoformis]|uniref:GNAT family N-acetyltransferase n=1 Tax=Amycolatopsis rhabdoformis TaxID=1448059 RepID=A0ABZ1IGC3_9PSEU|nr:GNAT family N-acetyltransferase [Amycolatopsis rhabdoformis]WSE32831.1 GNAT family N-acetyltransferase [Amycolatopsis rhabdoformis]
MDHSITAVSADSVPGFVSSVAALFREDGGHHDAHMDLTWPEREGPAYYAGLLADENALCLVAQGDAGVIGHLVGRLRRSDPLRPGVVTAVLESMRVTAGVRRTGVGTALVGRFTEWAELRGADSFEVTAYCANEPARAFYRRHGFRDFEVTLRR